MAVIHFLGRVLPAIANITLHDMPRIKWVDGNTQATWLFDLDITDSNVRIKCDTPVPDDLAANYMRALDVAKSAVNLVAFQSGTGLTVALEKQINTKGVESSLLIVDPALPARCTAFDMLREFGAAYKLVIASPPLFMILDDLIVAITLPHAAAVNCARAVDGIKHLISPNAKTEKAAWTNMQAALNLKKDYLAYITAPSAEPRHGKRTRIEGPVATEMVHRSWSIMNRYLEYLTRGGTQPLPISDFPLLTA